MRRQRSQTSRRKARARARAGQGVPKLTDEFDSHRIDADDSRMKTYMKERWQRFKVVRDRVSSYITLHYLASMLRGGPLNMGTAQRLLF